MIILQRGLLFSKKYLSLLFKQIFYVSLLSSELVPFFLNSLKRSLGIINLHSLDAKLKLLLGSLFNIVTLLLTHFRVKISFLLFKQKLIIFIEFFLIEIL